MIFISASPPPRASGSFIPGINRISWEQAKTAITEVLELMR
jgi:hypothetical protein